MESKSSKCTSIRYHNIFDYKLTKEELIKWQYKNLKETTKGVKNKTRLQREKYSKKKLIIAKRAAGLISKIKTVKFIGITGALAMMNASKNSDIDLIVITKKGYLWTTRLFSYLAIWLFGFKTRKPKDSFEKDKLCLNMWMDESDLVWDKKDRNIYTAHEIAQIVPLINKDKTYEKFIYLNRWILSYWPNSLKIKNFKLNKNCKLKIKNLYSFIEYLSYKLQYWYMKNKITRETITPTRAIFHLNDWGEIVLSKLSS